MKKQVGILAVAAVFGLPTHAQTWVGGSGNNWSTAANWSGGAVPSSGPATAVTFDGTALSFTPNVDTVPSLNSLSVTSAGYSFSNQAIGFIGPGAILSVTQPGTSFANTISFQANTTVHNTHPLTLSGGVTGTASFTKTGAGTLVLTGPSWHNGSAIVTAGTLQIGDGASTPLSTGAIVDGAALVFDGGPLVIVDTNGAITGSGTLTITAGSSVRNAGPFPISHQGLTTVNGTLTLQGGGMNSNGALVIGPAGNFTIMTPSGATVGSISGPAGSSLAVNNGTLVTGSDDSSTTFAGSLNGGGNIRKVGAGTFTVTSSNWILGTLEVDAGTMRIGDGAAGPTNLQAITVDGTLEFDRAGGTITVPGPVTGTGDIWVKAGTSISHLGFAPFTHQGLTLIDGTFTGGAPASIDNNGPVVISSTGRLSLSGSATVGSVAGSGRIDALGSGFTVGGDNTSTTISGLLSGSADFRKVGSGTLTVSSTSFFDGDTTVEAPGTLQIGNGTQGPGILRALTVNGTLLLDAPNVGLNGQVSGTGTLRVQAGSTVYNFSGAPLSHQGPTIVNGTLDSSGTPLSIDNNAPLVIGPSGTFQTTSGNVGSIAGFGTFNAMSGTFAAGGDNTSTTFAGTIGGSADFRKTGSGTLTLATASFFGGDVIVEAPGALRLGDGTTGPTNVQTLIVDGGLLFNAPTINVNGNISGNGTVTVQTGSTVSYNGSFPMTHAGTTIISGQLNSPAVAAISNGSPLLLSGGLLTRGGNVGSIAGGGTLQLAAGGNFTTGGNNVPTAYAGVLSGAGGLVKTGTGVFTLSGTSPSYAGQVQIATGTLNVTGTVGTSGMTVATGATLTGTGTVSGPVNVEIGGTVAPGASPGTLTTGNFSLAGTLQVEVLGTAPGTQHDRIAANGVVTLNGGTLALSGGYVPVPGNTLTIIANDGTDAVVGSFAGLPEGGTLSFNGVTLSISYVGGTGNDVVLSVANFTVTPSAGSNGTISPNTPQSVAPGGTLVFTLSPNTGFSPSVTGTCGGNLVGNTFTTNAVNANCSVIATFAATTYTVTPSAGPNGVISPNTPQSIGHGATATFTVTPSPGYVATVGGSCGGTLAGTSYVTNAITASCTVSATFAASDAARLVNISGRMQVGTGDNVMIGGFIIGGSSPKTVLVRGRGPSLVAQGLPDALRDPQMQLFSGQTQIGSNDNWGDAPNAAQVTATGLAPTDPLDAAILVTLAPGAYTAIVSGVGGLTGIGIVEVFEVDTPQSQLVNISTRGRVGVGDQVIIAGLIIQGTGPQQVVVRARGPSLAAFGVPGVLANPAMTLVRSSDQTVVGVNDNWGDAANASALSASGFAPTDPNEAALLVTLTPGAYTVVVNGVANSTGVAIVEVFAAP